MGDRRLTEKGFNYCANIRTGCYMGFDNSCPYPHCNGCSIKKMYNRLQELEDKLEDGRLLEIPRNLAPDDTIYYLDREARFGYKPLTVKGIRVYGRTVCFLCTTSNDVYVTVRPQHFDRTVFTSKEAVEAAVKKKYQSGEW